MKQTIAHIGALVIGLVIVALLIISSQPAPATGSVVPTGEYRATTTYLTANATSTYVTVCSRTLGSIVVGSTTDRTFEVRDATSTTDVSSTTVARLGASPANGTYTYDVSVARGNIYLNLPDGFNGSYTITCR